MINELRAAASSLHRVLAKARKANRGSRTQLPTAARDDARPTPGPQEKLRMATAAPNQSLPLFYNAIEPLNSTSTAR